ncbi:EmrA/EmrK family multidrug efflux transporter periplasmic adaptor subunit, partial [Paraburkholderia sp. BR10923]
DTRDESGSQLGAAQNTRYSTDVFARYDAKADAEIDRIIKQNETVSRAIAAQPQSQSQSQGLASHQHKANAG